MTINNMVYSCKVSYKLSHVLPYSAGVDPGYKEGGIRVRVCYVQSTSNSYGLWGHSPSEMQYRDTQALSCALATLGTLQPA